MFESLTEVLLLAVASLLLLGGIVFCVLPPLPGPLLSWSALLLLWPLPSFEITGTYLLAWGLVTLVVMAAETFLPVAAVQRAGGTKWALWGALLGAILGFFLPPFGFLLGPLVGAILGDLLATRKWKVALRSGLWSFLGFVLGTLAKLAIAFGLPCHLLFRAFA
ncbi:MAG: DUF456 domain-containing protein [Verrucomicrobiota bacterium]